MIFAMLDVDFHAHPKAVRVGPAGRDLYVAGLCYCKKYLTDGLIPAEMIEHLTTGEATVRGTQRARKLRITDAQHPTQLAHNLVIAGLWDVVECGWKVHDYAQRNPPADIERERIELARSKKRRWWEKHRARPDTRPSSDASSTRPLDPPLDRLVTGPSRARVALASALPPIGPPSSARSSDGTSTSPAQQARIDAALDASRNHPDALPQYRTDREATLTCTRAWQNHHPFHVHRSTCRFS